MKKKSLKGIFVVLKESVAGFIDARVLKLSASLAYYTIFSLAPLLVVILYLFGIFLGKEAIEGSIYEQMEGFIGKASALQLQDMIRNASVSGKGHLAAVLGVITLFIGATSIFAEIQDSINMIWGLKTKPGKSLLQFLQARILSFGLIVSLGFLLLVSLGLTTLIEVLSNKLREFFPYITVVFAYIINLVVSFAVISTLFAVIFKVLPDAKIRWQDVIAGAITSALLFMAGKFGVSYYISRSDIGNTYGAAGSLVVLILWIYYSSIILYFGAEFTKRYALKYGKAIIPSKYAVAARHVEIEEEGKTVQSVDQKQQQEKLQQQLKAKKN